MFVWSPGRPRFLRPAYDLATDQGRASERKLVELNPVVAWASA